MAYYGFDRYAPQRLDEIEVIVEEANSVLAATQPQSSIDLHILPYKTDTPIVLQTANGLDHHNGLVRSVLQCMILICKPSKIYDGMMSPYDLDDFLHPPFEPALAMEPTNI